MPLRTTLLLVPALAAALIAPLGAKDKGGHSAGQSRNRTVEWDRRTDTEWRRYTDRDAGRRVTDREMQRRTERMRGLDSNRDGMISRQEWRGNDRSFAKLDRDRDGVLTTRDRDGRYTPRPGADRLTRRNDRLRGLDLNGDGVISQDEWNRR